MDVTDLENGKSVAWKCASGPPEWVDTTLSFGLKTNDEGKTLLRFKHSDWKSTEQSFGMVNYQWAMYLKSLKDFVETGTGQPNTM